MYSIGAHDVEWILRWMQPWLYEGRGLLPEDGLTNGHDHSSYFQSAVTW